MSCKPLSFRSALVTSLTAPLRSMTTSGPQPTLELRLPNFRPSECRAAPSYAPRQKGVANMSIGDALHLGQCHMLLAISVPANAPSQWRQCHSLASSEDKGCRTRPFASGFVERRGQSAAMRDSSCSAALFAIAKAFSINSGFVIGLVAIRRSVLCIFGGSDGA